MLRGTFLNKKEPITLADHTALGSGSVSNKSYRLAAFELAEKEKPLSVYG